MTQRRHSHLPALAPSKGRGRFSPVRTALCCLLGGLVISWAVACGQAAFDDRLVRLPLFAQNTGKQVGWSNPTDLRFDSVDASLSESSSARSVAVPVLSDPQAVRVTRPATMRYGWPIASWDAWYSKAYGYAGPVKSAGDNRVAFPVVGIPIWHHGPTQPGDSLHVRRLLPLVPVPLAAAVNAAVSAVPCAGLGWGWRRWRKSKQLCARCGYSMAGLSPGAVCPECGHT